MVAPMAWGFGGVDLFFVLSGFLITGILLRTRYAEHKVKSFYMRRALRIFPLYYLVVLILWFGLAPHFRFFETMLPMLHGRKPMLAYLFYLQNWLILLNQQVYGFNNLLGHFWSLAVEEQFYFLWPWLVWQLSRRAILRFCGAALLLSFACRFFLDIRYGPASSLPQLVLPITRGDGLFVGAALAVMVAEHGCIARNLVRGLAGLGVGLFLLIGVQQRSFLFLVDSGWHPRVLPFSIPALALLSGALVGTAVNGRSGMHWLSAAWLRWFGRYSYGIYVYHAILYSVLIYIARAYFRQEIPFSTPRALVFLGFEIAVTLPIAWLSFTYFEAPILRLKRYFRPT